MAAVKKPQTAINRDSDAVVVQDSAVARAFADRVYRKTNGPTAELKRVYEVYLDNERRRRQLGQDKARKSGP